MTLTKLISFLLGCVFLLSGIAPSKAKPTAYKAWEKAYKQKITKSTIWAYIDFSAPATAKRFVIMEKDKEIYRTYVAHGVGSGAGYWAETFSNVPNSKKTSIGVYKLGAMYYGKYGKSQKLHGLEQGWNNNAYKRFIVVHPAPYAGPPKFGTSWGCFALPPQEINKIYSLLKEGSIIVAYYPDQSWLKTSRFLRD